MSRRADLLMTASDAVPRATSSNKTHDPTQPAPKKGRSEAAYAHRQPLPSARDHTLGAALTRAPPFPPKVSSSRRSKAFPHHYVSFMDRYLVMHSTMRYQGAYEEARTTCPKPLKSN